MILICRIKSLQYIVRYVYFFSTVDQGFFACAFFSRFSGGFFNCGVLFSRTHSFSFLFYVKITHFESFASCNFCGLYTNREKRKNKAPAKKTRSTVFIIQKKKLYNLAPNINVQS